MKSHFQQRISKRGWAINKKLYIPIAILVGIALVLTIYKVVVLGYSFFPKKTAGFWTVELQVNLRGPGRSAKVEAYLPTFTLDQALLDEKGVSGGLRYFIRESGVSKQNRLAVWSGPVRDTLKLTHTSTVRIDEHSYPLRDEIAGARSRTSLEPWLKSTSLSPANAKSVRDAVAELTRPGDTPSARIKKLFQFLSVEVETSQSDKESDPLLTLQSKKGNAEGKARLFTALVRASGIPSRVVGGILLKEGTASKFHVWNGVYLDGWVPVDTTRDLLAKSTDNMLVLHRGGIPNITVSGVRASSFEYRVVRELQSVVEQTRALGLRADNWVNRVSLLPLPLNLQLTFKILLLIPLGCLIIAILRNIVGINTFGTFMPVLLAMAFLQTSLGWGILFLAITIGLGVSARKVLDGLHLLRVPRIGILLTVVILILIGLTVFGKSYGIHRALAVGFFPIIVMAMMIERLFVTLEEEGTRNAMIVSGYTTIAAAVSYAAISWEFLQDFFFLFPETLLIIIALLLLIGRYTGYRLSEYFRFRAFHSPR